MLDLAAAPAGLAIVVFIGAALVIAFAGYVMAGTVDRLADRTGIGESLLGGVLLGASTSFSGIVTSVTAAAEGHATFAVSNAVGGIPAQTFFLALADIIYRRANLEHAAASLPNMFQGVMLVGLISLPILAYVGPPVAVLGIHPVSPALIALYLLGVRTANQMQRDPMWHPRATRDTRLDVPEEPRGGRRTISALASRFVLLGLVVGAAGFAIAESGVALLRNWGISESVVGALMTAVATSMPELVTTLAAVRRGALTLAVGGIIGGNTFDVLLIAFSDFAYAGGSVYHEIGAPELFLMMMTITMTATLVLGLLRRERHGPVNIGFESTAIIGLYAATVAGVFLLS
jgi:cation:H+ antiporter